MKRYFITAIGTDSGKTLFSAILTEALQADYWKPIQCGTAQRDADTVQALLSNGYSMVHTERHALAKAASPHDAAAAEGVSVSLDDFVLPDIDNDLVIEGAGGALVPLNDTPDFVIDLALRFNAQVIVVANLYLGSINHTLLTFEALKSRNIPVAGIVFNGAPNPASESIILKYTGWPLLFRIPQLEEVNDFEVKKCALLWAEQHLNRD